MVQVAAQLLERQSIDGNQELRLHAPELVDHLNPGQPVLIRTSWGLAPYLRRTFYPIAFDDQAFTVRIPPSSDRGHAWLRLAPAGAQLDCLGPVGVGFSLPPQANRILCLGEEEWAWTLLPLITAATERGCSVTLAAQARTARRAIPAQRLPLSVEYRLVTLDRGRGVGGHLRALFPELVPWADAVFVAGTLSMYQQLRDCIEEQRFLLRKDFAQALYPSPFLCGTGACQACVADVAGGRRRVCLRGPVFDLVDIFR